MPNLLLPSVLRKSSLKTIPRLAASSRASFFSVLAGLGLTNNLKLCLDPGDGRSYGSGQTWFDVSSTATNFQLGSTSGAAADDPTFNGTVNGVDHTAFWSFGGTAFFQIPSANPTWMNNLHKTGAKFGLATWVRTTGAIGGTANFSIIGAITNYADIGIWLRVTGSSNDINLTVANGSGSAAAREFGMGQFITGSWVFIALGFEEATSNEFGFVNTSWRSVNAGPYLSPSSSNAGNLYCIGAGRPAIVPNDTVCIQGPLAMWEQYAPTPGEFMKIFEKTRGRFGI